MKHSACSSHGFRAGPTHSSFFAFMSHTRRCSMQFCAAGSPSSVRQTPQWWSFLLFLGLFRFRQLTSREGCFSHNVRHWLQQSLLAFHRLSLSSRAFCVPTLCFRYAFFSGRSFWFWQLRKAGGSRGWGSHSLLLHFHWPTTGHCWPEWDIWLQYSPRFRYSLETVAGRWSKQQCHLASLDFSICPGFQRRCINPETPVIPHSCWMVCPESFGLRERPFSWFCDRLSSEFPTRWVCGSSWWAWVWRRFFQSGDLRLRRGRLNRVTSSPGSGPRWLTGGREWHYECSSSFR